MTTPISKPPIIRWAGSKRNSISNISPYWPGNTHTYMEPFCGSSALFFSLSPTSAILSDTNHRLINFYNSLKSNYVELHSIYDSIPEGKDHYYSVRDLFNSKPGCIEEAAYFLYLNQYCFNGLYRTNKKGHFNVPYSGQKNRSKYSLSELLFYASSIQNAEFYACDFECIIKQNISENTFLFVDPPYVSKDGIIFTEYGETPFNLNDLSRLIDILKILDRANGKFVLTYDSCLPFLIDLPVDWRISSFNVRRNVSGFSAARKMAEEIIVSNF